MTKLFTLIALFCYTIFVNGQGINITGKVTDISTGEALPGVSIIIQGTTQGTIADNEGNYSIDVSEGQVLEFSYMGYLNETVAISGQTQVDVAMIVDLLSLDEIVVVGYGTQKKSLVTGAISKVDGEGLNKNVARVEEALQGKLAGVTVLQESGSPGAGLTVRVRGTSTNGNANPLFIVDGMRTGGIDYLNTNDIESIEVLKDASAAAIYGAEAGNGVIIITTKSGGDKGKTVVNYNFNYGIQQPGKTTKVLNAEQYATYYREGLRHEIKSQYEGVEVPDVLLDRAINRKYPFYPDSVGKGTDWLGEIFENAPMMEHNISISGGNEKSSIFASGAFFDQDGIVGGNKANFNRYTARLNVNHQAKEWLAIGANISFTHLQRAAIDENNEFGGAISNAMSIDPLTPVYYNDTSEFPEKYKKQIYDNFEYIENSSLASPDGKYYGMSTLVQNEIRNPRAQINNKHSIWTTDKLIGNVNAGISPFKGLKLKTDYAIDLSMGTNKYWNPRSYYHSINFNLTSNTGQDNHRWFNWQWENTATYNRDIGNHNIMLLGGMTVREDTYNTLSGFGESLLEESWNFAVLDAVQSDSTKAAAKGGNRNADTRLLSYFGRVQYNFMEKYMVDLILRCDASSKLSPENRFQYFPSGSLGWVITNEDFWNFPVINFMKLRTGWGQNGSLQTLHPLQFVSTIESTPEASYYLSGGTRLTGAEPKEISNADLIWETSEQTNFGFDMRLLNNRIAFTADYYIKKTKDLLSDAAIPQYVGNNIPKANAGEATNKGIELEFSLKGVVSAFSYNIGMNANYNINKVTSLATPLSGHNLGTTGHITRSEEGLPIWYYYGYKTDGIFNSFDEIRNYKNNDGELIQPDAIPGDVKFIDIKPDGKINEEDKTMIGSPHPDWILGFNTNLKYKDFDIAVSMNAFLGYEIYFGAYRTDLTNNNKPLFFYEKAWTPENYSQEFPRYTVTDRNGNFSHNDLFVFDGSHVRLQNVELGYSMPAKLLGKAGVDRFRLYVSGRNLFVFSPYVGNDPEVGNSGDSNSDRTMKSIGIDRGLYPKARVFSFGINMTF